MITQTHKALRTRLTIFSDNKSKWYINGHTIHFDTQGGFKSDISAEWHPCGDNLLAVQVSNDNAPSNPFGLQYLIEAVLVPSQPCGLTTTAPRSAALGEAIHDTAYLRGITPLSGTIAFSVYGPNDATCSTPIVVPPVITVNGEGDYPSGNFTPTLPGTYRWRARYSGDANNRAVSTACNEPNETSVVTETIGSSCS